MTVASPTRVVELPPRWTPLRHHPEQSRLWNSPARVKVVAAGRSSGKTELAKRRVVTALTERVPDCPRPLYFIAGPTHSQTKRIYWDDLKALVPPSWLARPPGESELHICTKFGSELYVTGLDVPARIEGTQWCGGIVDESPDIRPGAWGRSIRPALSGFAGWCWRIGVPKRFGIGIAEFRTAFEGAGDNAFWWKSSDILTPDEIASARTELSPEDFKEQYEAAWLDSGGTMFPCFDKNVNVRPCPTHEGTIWIGADFNRMNMSWVLAYWDGSVLEVFDEIRLDNATTTGTAKVLRGRYPGREFAFCGDATSRARKTAAALSDYLQLKEVFPDARFCVPKANPPVADRVAATNRLLKDAADNVRLFIAPHCKHLLSDLQFMAWEGWKEEQGHASDGLGYLIHRVAPLRLERKAPALRRAG